MQTFDVEGPARRAASGAARTLSAGSVPRPRGRLAGVEGSADV
ncbi:hypothetical protein [Actinobaculum sp. oral taxon 183]|nr:hypothetical protein [Actinobaculum sp. oral taxon 183]